MHRHLEFEVLIADVSSRFVDLRPQDLDHEIEEALRRVCGLLGFDLAVLWQWSSVRPGLIEPTHSYSTLGLASRGEPMSQEQYPWTRAQLLAGRQIAIRSLDELPPEATRDRETCLAYGIRSALCLPLGLGGGAPVGALGFNMLGEERDWPEHVVRRLQLIAEVFTNALARRRYEERLVQSEERTKLAVDSALAGLWTLERGAAVFWASAQARSIFGYRSDEEISRERFEASVHPADFPAVREALRAAEEDGAPIDLEYRIVRGDDAALRWIATRGRSCSTDAGARELVTGISIDVTDRRLAEESYRRNEARLDSAAALAGLGFYEVDFERGLAYVDARFVEICGLPMELHGLEALELWIQHLHPDDRPSVLEVRRELHAGEREEVSLEYRYLHPAKGERWLHHLARVSKRDADGRARHTYGVLRDTTERKRAEEELGELGRHLVRAQEEERAQLARELHDDFTQRLAALAIQVGRAEQDAPTGALATALHSVTEELARLSEDVHALAYQLHPMVLTELGLEVALRGECERLGRRIDAPLTLEIGALPAPVQSDIGLCLFRVAQEALSNVARHAAASAVSVSLAQVNGGLALTVRDDGMGFELESSVAGRRIGLVSMRERVRQLAGRLTLDSAPGRGTRVTAWVPIREGSA